MKQHETMTEVRIDLVPDPPPVDPARCCYIFVPLKMTRKFVEQSAQMILSVGQLDDFPDSRRNTCCHVSAVNMAQ